MGRRDHRVMWADWCSLVQQRTEGKIKLWQFHHCLCVQYQFTYILLNTNSDFTFSPTSLSHHSTAAPKLEERYLQLILCFSKSSKEGVLLPHLITNLPKRNWGLNLLCKRQPFIPLVTEQKRKEILLFQCISARWTHKSLLSVHFHFREARGTASIKWALPMRRCSIFSLVTTKWYVLLSVIQLVCRN